MPSSPSIESPKSTPLKKASDLWSTDDVDEELVTSSNSVKTSMVLVRKGHAYYLNEHKVVVGYQIANSTVPYTVFLPVFSFYRESFLSKIRNGINKFAKFTVATFRMKLYMKEMDEISKKVLKKPFPMVLLHIIGLYCYDPFLLVKR